MLLQLEVPDRFRGRVFAAELALVTLVTSVSGYWTGYELDRVGRSPRTLSFVLGALFCLPGVLLADDPRAVAGIGERRPARGT